MNKERICEENQNCIKYAKYSFVLIFTLFLITSTFTVIISGFNVSVTEYLIWVAIFIFNSHLLYAYIFNTTMYLAGAIIDSSEKYRTIRKVSVALSFILFVLLVKYFVDKVFYI
jgi:hypothetical protein